MSKKLNTNKYEKFKNVKKESIKSYYLVKEICKNINDFNNLENYIETIDIIKNLYIDDENEVVILTYRELEKIIKSYIFVSNNKNNKYDYNKLNILYNVKTKHDKIFNNKLNRIINNNDKRGIMNELIGYILYDGIKKEVFN